MKYRMLITDLDDTLLNDNLEIGLADRETILSLDAAGIPVILCSGRPTASIRNIADNLFPRKENRTIIGFNGAAVTELATGKNIFECALPVGTAAELTELAASAGITAQVYHGDRFFVAEATPEAARYSEATGLEWEAVGCLKDFMAFSPLKVLFHAAPEKLAKVYPEAQRICGGRYRFTYSKPHYLEFIHPDVSKGSAIEFLCKKLGINIEETVAVGDSLNDMEMLKTAGLSLAVANARQEVKETVNHLLHSDNNSNPITEAVNRFFKN